MSNIKERLIGAITVMENDDAIQLWNFVLKMKGLMNWDDIEEVAPDEIDLHMIKEAENDPDCHDFS